MGGRRLRFCLNSFQLRLEDVLEAPGQLVAYAFAVLPGKRARKCVPAALG